MKDVSNILIWGAGQHTCKLFEKTSILSYDVKQMDDLEYVIAEQDNFYEYGHKHLEDKTLKFINSRDEFGIHGKFDIVLFLLIFTE